MNIRQQALIALAASIGFAGIAQAMPTSEYLMKAGAGDLYEKTSSKIVLKSTKNADIRKFANMMIMDHTKSTNDVKTAAMKSGLKPKPPMLSPEQQSMITALTAAKGTARDNLYVEQQKTAHQDALAVQQDYSTSGDKAPLRMVAGNIVPVVQQHLSMLSSMPAMSSM